jgi:hypothetical protein
LKAIRKFLFCIVDDILVDVLQHGKIALHASTLLKANGTQRHDKRAFLCDCTTRKEQFVVTFSLRGTAELRITAGDIQPE